MCLLCRYRLAVLLVIWAMPIDCIMPRYSVRTWIMANRVVGGQCCVGARSFTAPLVCPAGLYKGCTLFSWPQLFLKCSFFDVPVRECS